MTKDFLKPSKWTNGRWCIGNNELSCGYPISVKIKNRWVQGRVEHTGKSYYFLSDNFRIDLSENLYTRDDYKK
ncbi:hypothetical protein D2A34_05185 [Clostridium chromiireducens]|uniref:DUF5348 domain-containing protein n=1 Tax=Clostridium chromiireducens TaxID=225345 RepID=A0A399IWE3_9CLOT|nr:DUF5348 domain-containing protein [Clostridium chromiireducens]RII36777.1 hypothetical protein D2A34_05185 [Clostridium chromiireducens]